MADMIDRELLLGVAQLAAMMVMGVGLLITAAKAGKILGAVETLLNIHTREIKELWEAKQDKDVCVERHNEHEPKEV